MLVIGLTGGIGSGKSEATRILERLGAVVFNADRLGHEAYRTGTSTWHAIVKAFGDGVVGDDGEIDRKLLGGIVFGGRDQLVRLSEIVWPEIRRVLAARIANERREGTSSAVVVEAAVLLEAGWDDLVDEVWVVDVPESIAVSRLQARGMSPETARSRSQFQSTRSERNSRAQVLIRNDTDLKGLETAIRKAWDGRVRTKA